MCEFEASLRSWEESHAIHSCKRHFTCFHILAAVSIVSLDIRPQLSSIIWYPLFWIIPRIMIWGSSGSSWFHFLSKLTVIFLNGYIKICSDQQCTILPSCYIKILSNAGYPISSFIGDSRIWTQDFILVNKVLYPLSHTTTPLLWFFLRKGFQRIHWDWSWSSIHPLCDLSISSVCDYRDGLLHLALNSLIIAILTAVLRLQVVCYLAHYIPKANLLEPRMSWIHPVFMYKRGDFIMTHLHMHIIYLNIFSPSLSLYLFPTPFPLSYSL
jgi:hypothetical protein